MKTYYDNNLKTQSENLFRKVQILILGSTNSLVKSLNRMPGVAVKSICNVFSRLEFFLFENFRDHTDVVLIANHTAENTTIAEVQLIRKHSQIPIVAMVRKNFPLEFICKAAKAGVNGLVIDSAPDEEIFNAIHTVLSKKFYLSAPLKARLLRLFNQNGLLDKQQFSKRQQQILERIIAGDSDKEIAFGLKISVNTIHSHKYRIYKKLDVSSREEAADKYLLLKIMNGEFKGFNTENVTQFVTQKV